MDALRLVEQCYNLLPSEMKATPWEATEHGRKVLQNENELNAYIAAYGEMHIVKCRAALQNFPFKELENHPYEIFDWGCGQGLATLTLLEMLYDRRMLSRLHRIYLIEPSKIALNRAKDWAAQFAGPGVEIVTVNNAIPQNNMESMDDVTCESRISINLFSNILDIRTLSLSWLSSKVASLASINYIVCVGPKFDSNSNTRLVDFCGYFNVQNFFSVIDSYPYEYTSNTHHAYGCQTRCFVHRRNDSMNNGYQECASVTHNYDIYEDCSSSINDQIENIKVRFYHSLQEACGKSYDVFFEPNINCDYVDYIAISLSKGIVLINVCNNLDDLEDYYERLENIKSNLFNVHLKSFKIDSITYKSVYNNVKIALYFPNANEQDVTEKITWINSVKNENEKEINDSWTDKDFFAYDIKICSDSDLHNIFENISTHGFKFDYYNELVNLISSRWHRYKDGDTNFQLTNRQLEFVRSENNRLRVRGVAGCGKTQVIANRAVERHIKTGAQVLILTFNISLIQYVRMRINQVPADFAPNKFEIINYHQFFKSKANLYKGRRLSLDDFDDPNFFDSCRENIRKYHTILIDEVQDFKNEWLQSIVHNFLEDNGTISVFGDGEQNIYDRVMEDDTKMPSLRGCGFAGGRWPTMSERISMRILNPQIANLSSRFAHHFFENVNEQIEAQQTFLFDQYFIEYWNVSKNTTINTLTANIRWILEQYKLNPREVAVLAQSINLLRDLENMYVNTTRRSSMINFETLAQYINIRNCSSPAYIKKDLEEVRRTAKTHFTTDTDAIKLSTIHSFKGWESKSVILILQPEMESDERFDGYAIHEHENIPALIYTALTRAKCNLFIINLGNPTYNSFFNQNIN